MTLFARLCSFLTTWTQRGRFEESLSEEMQFHLKAQAEDLIRTGVPLAEATRLARMQFGCIAAMKDACRRERGLRITDEFASRIRWKTWYCVARLLQEASCRALARAAAQRGHRLVEAVAVQKPKDLPVTGTVARSAGARDRS